VSLYNIGFDNTASLTIAKSGLGVADFEIYGLTSVEGAINIGTDVRWLVYGTVASANWIGATLTLAADAEAVFNESTNFVGLTVVSDPDSMVTFAGDGQTITADATTDLGNVTIGASPGTTTLTGTYVQSANSTLTV